MSGAVDVVALRKKQQRHAALKKLPWGPLGPWVAMSQKHGSLRAALPHIDAPLRNAVLETLTDAEIDSI